jgi:histidine triad (HIT) family protein
VTGISTDNKGDLTKSSKQEPRIFTSRSVDPKDCIFCQIVARKLPAYVVFEDVDYIAFLDKSPLSEGHTLVSPKKHGETLWDMNESEIGGLFMTASRVSRAVVFATSADGFRVVQNNGEASNQIVPHVHVHIIPVKLSEKGKWLERKTLPPDAMDRIAKKIKAGF